MPGCGAGAVVGERLFYAWRWLATAFCFALFGAGGVLLRFVYFPLIALVVRAAETRVRHARAVIRFTFRTYIATMHGLGVLQYSVQGAERLSGQGKLILANHPSLIDTVFLMALVRDADCIVKADLQANFFTRGPVRAAGYVMNDHGMDLINDCIASLAQGNNLIVFPEGTRTPADGQIRLRRGAANIAVRSRTDITPVVIRCTPRTLIKGQKWWLIPARQVRFSIDVRETIAVSPFLGSPEVEHDHEAVAARALTAHLQSYFNEEFHRHA